MLSDDKIENGWSSHRQDWVKGMEYVLGYCLYEQRKGLAAYDPGIFW